MATKRLLEDTDNISDRLEGKRVRRWPSITVVIKRAVEVERMKIAYRALFREVMKDEMEQWFPHLASFREVVQEEVDRGFLRHAALLQRSPQMLIEEPKSPSALQLVFKKQPSDSVFTENIIKDGDGNPLQILLTEIATGAKLTTAFHSSIKLEIVVLDGDFPCDDSKNWSSSEFDLHVLKERERKRPLLIGNTVVKLKDGAAAIDELKFTDNSSWRRNKNFRIGVRVSSENRQSLNIREAVSSPIVVKDHRGETSKKHYPPLLSDEVWRLKNIGKDGVFHTRLVEKNINTVQDFLKLLVIDSAQLRKTLGTSMSERKWLATIDHARTCSLNPNSDVHNTSIDGALMTQQELNMPMRTLGVPERKWEAAINHAITCSLNPNSDVHNTSIDGALMTHQELNMPMRADMQQSVLEAYNPCDSLAITSQVETHQNEVIIDVELMLNNELMGVENWPNNLWQ